MTESMSQFPQQKVSDGAVVSTEQNDEYKTPDLEASVVARWAKPQLQCDHPLSFGCSASDPALLMLKQLKCDPCHLRGKPRCSFGLLLASCL